MKTNHEWTRIDTNRHADRRAYFNDKRHPNVSAISCPWCDGLMGRWLPGSAGVPPAQSLAQPRLSPHLDRPGTAPWLSFGLADAVPADRVAACSTALKLSSGQRGRMRAGRPRSQATAVAGAARRRLMRGVSGGRLLRKPTGTLWETPVCPRAGPQPWRAEARLNMYRARARGFESSREAAAALSRGRKPMERDDTKPRAA